jgi:SAM-dependent methyltransferase
MVGSLKKWDGQRETLDDLSEAVHYNEWIYQMLRPYVGTRILEIGCGTGNLTGYLQKHGRVLAVDFHAGYLEAAKENLKGLSGITFKRINLEKNLASLRAFRPDTLICVNVLEHLSNDQQVLDRCLSLLPAGGRLLLFVPAFQFLFGTMDVSYGHLRRYSLSDLKSKMETAGFQVDYCRYLNLLGVFGWWLNGKILKKKIIPKSQMLLYDKVVRYSSKIERFLPRPLGLSLFCAGQKPKL